MRNALGNMLFAARWVLRAAVAALVAEAVALSIDGVLLGATLAETCCAILVAGLLAGLTGIGAGIGLGVLAAFAVGSGDLTAAAERRWSDLRGLLTTDDEQRRRSFVARMVAAILTVAAGSAAAILPATEVVAAIQTPVYAAILAVGVTLLCLLLSLLLWPVWRRAAHLLTEPFHPPAPGQTVVVASAVIVLAALLVVWISWDGLASYVPWRAPLASLGTLVLLGIWIAVGRSRPPGPGRRKVVGTIWAALLVAGAITAVAMPGSLKRTGYLLEDAAGPLAPAHSLLSAALDRDGDGHLPWIGGNDCAPGDPAIHPGAWDRPEDGIDQDCNGEDSTLADAAKPGRHDYPSRPHPRPMPVIVVTIDAVSSLRMELHGADRKTMPNLTRRAATGAVFDRAFSEGPATRLSFPSLLTGLHASQIRRKPSRRTTVPWIDVDHTIGTVFAGNGYRTVAVSPDRYFARAVRWLYDGFQVIDDSPARGGAGEHKNAEQVTEVALKRLDELKDERKFLLWVHYTDAHYPHRLPPGMEPVFGEAKADIYDAELNHLDEHLETFLAGVAERLGGRDHVVAVTADHGQAFDKKHEMWHQDHDVSTAVTWVPMIYWSPFSGARRIERLANIIDLLPTLMNMVGIEAEGIAGDSLLPAIQGQPDTGRPVMQQFFLPEYAVQGKDPLVRVAIRQGRHVLHQIRASGHEELYDFKDDPLETNDLLEQLPDVARQLRAIRDGKLAWAYPEILDARPTGAAR
jgi:arylsulfatase A-like enzyme